MVLPWPLVFPVQTLHRFAFLCSSLSTDPITDLHFSTPSLSTDPITDLYFSTHSLSTDPITDLHFSTPSLSTDPITDLHFSILCLSTDPTQEARYCEAKNGEENGAKKRTAHTGFFRQQTYRTRGDAKKNNAAKLPGLFLKNPCGRDPLSPLDS